MSFSWFWNDKELSFCWFPAGINLLRNQSHNLFNKHEGYPCFYCFIIVLHLHKGSNNVVLKVLPNLLLFDNPLFFQSVLIIYFLFSLFLEIKFRLLLLFTKFQFSKTTLNALTVQFLHVTLNPVYFPILYFDLLPSLIF